MGIVVELQPEVFRNRTPVLWTSRNPGRNLPDCSKPLLRLISLSATDPRLNLDPAKTSVVHLLYCWTCSIPYGVFSYHLRPNGSVELLDLPAPFETAFGPNGPYDGYTENFPLRTVGLIPL